MRKALYALLALILASGAYIFASTVIFPDVPWLPRLPQDPGTIGYVLKNFFRDDGTALNSEALGGISANEYLKKRTCTDAGEVWKGIGPDGYPICGPKWAGTLAQLGTIRDVTGTVKLNGSPAIVGMVVHQWDTITTDNASYTSVTFTDDASLLRLDQNTSVEMVAGNGTSLAQVIVNNGILWWRVLTTDGVDFGAGGYIAWVRGTSISVKKTGTTVEIAVIDSTNAQAATITNTNDGAKPSITVDAGSKVVETAGTSGTPTEEGWVSKATLLADDWVKKNTLTDIEYLDTFSGSTDATIRTRTKNEIDITIPTNPTDLAVLIPNPYPELLNDLTGRGAIPPDRIIECANMSPSRRYWSSLSNETSPNYCKEPTLFAYVDYTNALSTPSCFSDSSKTENIPKMYHQNGSYTTIIGNICNNWKEWYKVDEEDEYIRYTDPVLLEWIKWKTITLTLENASSENNRIIFDLTTSSNISICKIKWRRDSNNFVSDIGGTTTCSVSWNSASKKLSISVPSNIAPVGTTLSGLYIWNQSSGGKPIKNRITEVSIQ
jgi:hypothetical protein